MLSSLLACNLKLLLHFGFSSSPQHDKIAKERQPEKNNELQRTMSELGESVLGRLAQ